MSFEMKLSNGVATITHEYKTKAHCYSAIMVEHLMRNNKVFENCEQEDLQDAFQELILTNRTKIRVPRHEGADLTNEFERVVYTIEIIDTDGADKETWTHDFTINFSFSGMPFDWEGELSPADFRYKIQETLHNLDGDDILQRIECYNSFEETY